MTEENKTTEQDLRDLLIAAIENSDYEEHYTQQAYNSPEGFLQTHGPALGPILMSLSADRQEQILTQQHDVLKSMGQQSDVMTEHSQTMIRLAKAMFWLTLGVVNK